MYSFPVLGSLTPAEKDRRDRVVPDRASAVVEKIQTWTRSGAQSGMGAIRLLWGIVRAPRRRMRPAGNSGVTPGKGNNATRRSAVRPLSVEAVEFSPALAPEQNLLSGRQTMSSGAGGVVPMVVAGPPVPTEGGGATFTAAAEVHMSASVNEEDKLIAQASGQHVVCNTDPGKVPAILRGY